MIKCIFMVPKAWISNSWDVVFHLDRILLEHKAVDWKHDCDGEGRKGQQLQSRLQITFKAEVFFGIEKLGQNPVFVPGQASAENLQK